MPKEDVNPTPPEIVSKIVETMSHPLRNRVFAAILECPGITAAQITRRLSEPPRRIRHQVRRLTEVGLVTVDRTTTRRNARENHYRALHRLLVTDLSEDEFTDEQRRNVALSVLRLLIEDFGLAVADSMLATRAGHAEIRVPGVVDSEGWDELAGIVARTMAEIEGAMARSHERLQVSEGEEIEVTSALLLLELPLRERRQPER
jgi:DNA-binding transcriptional ArsR family regulator